MNEKIELQKNRDFSEKISATFDFIRKEFKTFFGAVLFLGGPLVIVLSFAIAYTSVRAINMTQDLSEGVTNNLLITYGNAFISYIAWWLIYNLLNIVTFSYFKIYKKSRIGTQITPGMVWDEAKRHILPVLGSAIVVGIILSIGMVFLVIPFFILLVYTSLINSVIIMEDVSFGKAFSRSFDLLTDNYWSTFGLVIVLYILVSVFSFVFSIPATVVAAIWGFNSLETIKDTGEMAQVDGLLETVMFVTQILANLGRNFLVVIPGIAMGFQYFHLKEVKESTGLMEQIEQMGAAAREDDETY